MSLVSHVVRSLVGIAWLGLVVAASAGGAYAQGGEVLAFDAFDLKTGKAVFKGESTTRGTPETVAESVVYWDQQGTQIQSMQAEYERSTLMPLAYRRDFQLTGEWEALAREGTSLTVSWQAKGAKAPKSFELDWEDGVAIPAVVVPHILRAEKVLKAGKDATVELIVPSRQEAYTFRMRQDKPVTIEGQPTWVVRMEPDSFLIRQLVDPLYFYFAADGSGRLIEYRGRTSVQDEQGEGIDARIVYHYPAKAVN